MRRLATRNPYGTRVFPSMHSGWLYTHASSCEHLYGWNVCLGYGCSVLPERLYVAGCPGYEHMCGLGELIRLCLCPWHAWVPTASIVLGPGAGCTLGGRGT